MKEKLIKIKVELKALKEIFKKCPNLEVSGDIIYFPIRMEGGIL